MKAFKKKVKKTLHKLGSSIQENDHDRKHHHDNHQHEEHENFCSTSSPAPNITESANMTSATLSSTASNHSITATNNKNDAKWAHSEHVKQINALHSEEEEFIQDQSQISQIHTSKQEIKPSATPLQTQAVTQKRKSFTSLDNTTHNVHDLGNSIEMSNANQNMASTELNVKTTDNQTNSTGNGICDDNNINGKDEVATSRTTEEGMKSRGEEVITVDTPKQNVQEIDVDTNKYLELPANTSQYGVSSNAEHLNDKAMNTNTISSLENSDDKFHIQENGVSINAHDSVDRESSIDFNIVESNSKNEEHVLESKTNTNSGENQAIQSMGCNTDNLNEKENSENMERSAIHNSHSRFEKTNKKIVQSAKANGQLRSQKSDSNTISLPNTINNCGTEYTEQLVRANTEHATAQKNLPTRSNNHRSVKTHISEHVGKSSSSSSRNNHSYKHRNEKTKNESNKRKDSKKICINSYNDANNNLSSIGKSSQPSSDKTHSRANHYALKSSVVPDNISNVSSNNSSSSRNSSSSVNVFDYKSLLNQCHRKAKMIAEREERLAQHERSSVLRDRNHRYRKAIEAWQSDDDDSVHSGSLISKEQNSASAKKHHRFIGEEAAQRTSHHSTHSRLPYRHGMHKSPQEEREHHRYRSSSQRSSRGSSQHIDTSGHSHSLKEKSMYTKEEGMQNAAGQSSQKSKLRSETPHSVRGQMRINSTERIASSAHTSPSQSMTPLSNQRNYNYNYKSSKRRSQSLSELSDLSNSSSTYTSQDYHRQTSKLKKEPSRRQRSSSSLQGSEMESVRSNNVFAEQNKQRKNTINHKNMKEYYKDNSKNDFLSSCKSDRSRSSEQISRTPHSTHNSKHESDLLHEHNEEEQLKEELLSNSMHTPERLTLFSLRRLHEGNDTEPSRMSQVEENMLKEVEERLSTLQYEMREYDAVLEQNMLSNSFERLYHLNNRRDREERESRLREFEKLTALKEKLLNGEIVKNLQARQERRKMWERQLHSPDNVFERLYMNSPTSSQVHRRERSRTASQNSRTSIINRNKNRTPSPNSSYAPPRSSRTSSSHSRRSAEEVCSLLYSDGLELTRRRARQDRQNAETRKAEELQELLIAKLAAQLRRSSRSDMEFLNSQLWLTRAREELHKRMERDPEHYVENILRGKKLTKEEQQMSARRLLIHGKAMKERLEAKKCKEEMKECTFHPKINDVPFSALLTSSSSTPRRTQSRKAYRSDNDNNSNIINTDNKYNANEPTRTKSDRCVYLYKSAQATRNRRAELEAKQAMERRESILKNRLDNDHHFRRRVQLDPTLAERFMNSLVV